ncbi:hypothetical protein KHA80_18610 [Anaerobacillus sp. HL2]|nr:hypothetical protein KHA80_18610 [Anaerobacillus sp. HL2]
MDSFGLYIYLGSCYSVLSAITTLKRDTSKIADGDFSTRIALNTKDEISFISKQLIKWLDHYKFT